MNTLGYHFKDVYMEFKGLEFAVRLSTENNVYSPDSERVTIRSQTHSIHLSSDRLSSAGGQIKSAGELNVDIREVDGNKISITATGAHPQERCKSIVVMIKRMDVQAFVCDSENMGKHSFSKKNGIAPIQYPGRSTMMPLVFVEGKNEDWFILSKDAKVRKKAFSAYHDYIYEQPVIQIAHEEDRRYWTNHIELPEWQLGSTFQRQDIVRERCLDLEKHFGFVPFHKQEKHRWIDEIKAVINFHGEHWTGYVYNTFEQMSNQLKWICNHIEGEHVLAFLPAWDGRYYFSYPEHKPSQRMGGEKGLKNFVHTAHQLGVKVVPMLGGPNLATFEFLKKHDLMDAALKNEWGFPLLQDWVDWNSDLSKECPGFIGMCKIVLGNI